jgi:hypothetical protein
LAGSQHVWKKERVCHHLCIFFLWDWVGFELRALSLQSRRSTTWAAPPALEKKERETNICVRKGKGQMYGVVLLHSNPLSQVLTPSFISYFQGQHSQWFKYFPVGPLLKGSTTFHIMLGTKLPAHEPLGDTFKPYQNHNTFLFVVSKFCWIN